MPHLRSYRAGARLRRAGLFGLIVALSLCLMPPGFANASKKRQKKDTVSVMTYNLYVGSGIEGDAPAIVAALQLRSDLLANEVGGVLSDIKANDFNVRAAGIAQVVRKKRIDLVGLQEAALWRLEVPTDGGGPPRGAPAQVPLIDYIDTLLGALNKKAKSKRACGKTAKKRKAQGKKKKTCYRGYRLVGSQQESDLEQFGDFDNDPGPDGKTFDLSDAAAQAALGAAAPSRWLDGNDDTPGVNLGEPPAPPFPQDANFDSHVLSQSPNPPFDAEGRGTDPAGVTDCPDTNPGAGPAPGGGGVWPFSGYNGDFDPNRAGSQVPVCMFHGIDGDIRVQVRDVILARNGAGVKTSNVRGANYSPRSTFSIPLLGLPITFNRGWVSADVSVRGKKFRLVNTHLESVSNGTFREDQAAELVAPGGPASVPKTVLVGDLNSDPAGPGESPIAYQRLAAAGFRSLTNPSFTSGHGQLLNDLTDTLQESRIDHLLTNSPSIRLGSSVVFDPVVGGLWASDHGGVLSRLKVPGGEKK